MHSSTSLTTGKTCTQCSAPFEITQDDLAFYAKVSPVIAGKRYDVPPPTLCPECRWRRRLCFRNERNLYHRKCDLSGRSMISMHPANCSFPVYHITEWMTDKWDPKTYGRDFDFSRSFSDQFKELCDQVPHFNAFVDPHMDINAEYTNCSSEAKNCYLITQAEKNEDCYYSRGINNCKDCCDCLRVQKCELCYECVNATDCYHCLFVQDCSNCSDCYFSSGLRGCKHCFGCHELSQKEYCIFNEQVTPEEWKKKVESLTLSHAVIDQMQSQSARKCLELPHKDARILQSENATGDHLIECRNAKECFDSRQLEDCAYCYEVVNGAKDTYDFSMFGLNCELVYECNGGGYGMHQVLFSNHCWNNVSSLLYCESCFPSVRDCFGCFGLRQAKYCIFNKQYTKEEYEVLVPKIIDHMRKSGEYGEFFDPGISAYDYNESLAGEFFPMTQQEVQKRGWPWREEAASKEQYLGPERSIPETINEAGDDISECIFRCEKTGKPYRIIEQELRLCRRLGVPPPKKCPAQRHLDRVAQRNPRKLWQRECTKCSKDIETTYAPERPEIVYCERCYLDTVY